MIRATVGVVLVLWLTGCGGSDGAAVYVVSTVQSCLSRAGADTRSEVDLLAAKANAGAFEAELPNGDVATLAFENTSAQAEAIQAAYRPFAEAAAGEVERHGNLVIAWDQEPAEDSVDLVNGCLG